MNDRQGLERVSTYEWLLPASGRMRVPGRICADEETILQLMEESRGPAEWSSLRQLRNVASLPGIVGAALALPDVHPGYGFPIGGVGAFDPDDGVVVVGGVGFDINCGVRCVSTPLTRDDVSESIERIGEDLHRSVPAGLGSKGMLKLSMREIDRVLIYGAEFAVDAGFGNRSDLECIEENGRMTSAEPDAVSDLAKKRQFEQIGTLGSGNHYLEVQWVDRILDSQAAQAYGLFEGQIVVSIHTGSRALGHQIGQDFLREMSGTATKYGIDVPERELACAPIRSSAGRRYLGAMAAGANCAFANRQAIAHRVRESLGRTCDLDSADVCTVYDVGHNNAKFERHTIDGRPREVLVHRKGSTRAFGPGCPETPAAYRSVGHPVFVGGTMGTESYVLRGTAAGMEKAFGSGIHGAGRALSRKKAAKRFWGETVLSDLADAGIRVWAHSARGVAEEAPEAYKDVRRVVRAAEGSGITQVVARLKPLAVIKG